MSTEKMTAEEQEARTKRIAELNDAVRTNIGSPFNSGRVMVTQGVHGLDEDERRKLLTAVRTYDGWDRGDDPYGEHDFGCVFRTVLRDKGVTVVSWTKEDLPHLEGGDARRRAFFKIDYYAKPESAEGERLTYGADEPWKTETVDRVMTIMLAEEY